MPHGHDRTTILERSLPEAPCPCPCHCRYAPPTGELQPSFLPAGLIDSVGGELSALEMIFVCCLLTRLPWVALRTQDALVCLFAVAPLFFRLDD